LITVFQIDFLDVLVPKRQILFSLAFINLGVTSFGV